MGWIYSEAQKVLGVANSETELAFQVINDVGHYRELLRPMGDDSRDTGLRKKESVVQSLVRRDYWQRVWIAQAGRGNFCSQ